MKRLWFLLLIPVLLSGCFPGHKAGKRPKYKPVEVSSMEALRDEVAIAKSWTQITLKPGTYDSGFIIEGKKHVKLQMEGVKLVLNTDKTIVTVENCEDVRIHGLTLYHEVGKDHCFTNCYDVNNSKSVQITNGNINGSGYIGVCVNQSEVEIINTKIHKCFMGVFIWDDNASLEESGELQAAQVEVYRCEFEDNEKGDMLVYSHYVKRKDVTIFRDDKQYRISPRNWESFQKDEGDPEMVIF